jgi:exodeoxyribonuclease VII large subunit
MPGRSEPAPAAGHPRPERVVLTVSELNALARDLLETAFPVVWVEGEISNLKRYPSGHVYFTLKDTTAQVSAVLFRGQAAGLRFRPEDGLLVVARGRVSLYEARGSYQVLVEALVPAGLGALQLAFEQLKAKLLAEGLFDPARKRPLPMLPRRIGVVASIAGAAVRDIVRVLERRFANLEVVIAPSRVQGEGAAREIVGAIDLLNRLGGVDVLILARGGGSVEDLWAFNEENVARAIAASGVPVVSAVGHEVDVTIADLVADLRAPTPSAAAEMVIASRGELAGRLVALRARLVSAAGRRLADARHRLADRGAWRALHLVRGRFRETAQRLDELAAGLHLALQGRVGGWRHRVEILAGRLSPPRLRERLAARREALTGLRRLLQGAAGAALQRRRQRLAAAGSGLEALSPLAVLGRGYAICFHGPGERAILKDAATVAPGDAVRVRLHRGSLGCAVTEVEHGGGEEG